MIWVENKPADISFAVSRLAPRSRHLGSSKYVYAMLYIIHCTLLQHGTVLYR